MKRKLLLILGSGSSVSLGMPTVGQVDQDMKRWAQEWTNARDRQNYFGDLWQTTATYYVGGMDGSPSVDFETVLGELIGLSYWTTPAPSGEPLRQFILGEQQSAFNPRDHDTAIELRELFDHLITTLTKTIRKRSHQLDRGSHVFREYAALLGALRQSFDVGIFNLNYDNIALSAMSGANTGFDKGRFDPRQVHAGNDFDYVYHLHGSVHFSLTFPNTKEICWRDNLEDAFHDSDRGIGPDPRSGEMLLPVTTLLAGGFKLDQLLAEPFHSFYASLVRDIHRADAILIGGYGFGDVHVNRALNSRVARHGARPPVFILDRRSFRMLPTSSDRRWATKLCAALRTDQSFFVEDRSSIFRRADTGEGTFMVNEKHPVALWDGGFSEAANHTEAIVSWLDRRIAAD
jgi:hypothetical protein